MGHFCKKHEWFVQDGEECKYCDTARPAQQSEGTEPSGRCAQSEGGPASGRSTGLPLPQPTYTDAGFYNGYDLLPLCGNQAVTPADIEGWTTPDVKQSNGMILPGAKIRIDPSLRADLAAEMERQELKRDLFKAIEKLIDDGLAKLRRGE